MKKFDKESIKERYVDYLKNSGYWNRILEDSAISLILDVLAERDAETNRYFEYLLKEAKWDYAQNISSLLSQAAYLGYKPKRRRAAVGEIIVSHNAELQGAGVSLFETDLDMLSPYAGMEIAIPEGVAFSTANGSFEVFSSARKIYSVGTKYLKIPVIQGVIKRFRTSSGAQGLPFEKVRILDNSIEAASDAVTSPFLRVQLYPGGDLNAPPVQVSIKENILLAGPDEYACDIKTSYDFSYVEIRFGDGTSGKILPKESIIEVFYVSTLGENGNIFEKYIINKIKTPFSQTVPFYCANFSAILGGKDHDTLDTIRANAPRQYLIGGSIITEDDYRGAIEEIPYIHRSTVYTGLYTDPNTGVIRDMVLFSAIDTAGGVPQKDQIESDLLARIVGRKSPLDIIKYEPPSILRLRFNISAKTTSQISSFQTKINNLTEALYAKYNILNQNFKTSFDFSKLIAYIRSIGIEGGVETLIQINPFIEAVEILKPSKFTPSSILGYYLHAFKFDTSYKKFKMFTDGVLYCLRIQIYFNCPGCEEKSRTIFLIQNENYNPSVPGSLPYRVAQYPYISGAFSYAYISNIILNPFVPPTEIPPLINGMTNPDYIPFEITYTGYLNDPNNLGAGVLKIPERMLNIDGSAGDIYINFLAENKEELDNTVSIKVYSIPFYADIHPDKNNNIFSVEKDDIAIDLSYGVEA